MKKNKIFERCAFVLLKSPLLPVLLRVVRVDRLPQ